MSADDTNEAIRRWAVNHARTVGRVGVPGTTDAAPARRADRHLPKPGRWTVRAAAEPAVLSGHTDAVWSIQAAQARDGAQLLVSASSDHTVRVWDVASGVCIRVLQHGESRVAAVAVGILPNGATVLASGNSDGAVRLWDLETGELRQTLSGHTAYARTVAFGKLPDGTVLLASGGYDETVRLWDPMTGRPVRTLEGHASKIFSVTFVTLPGGTVVLASGGDQGEGGARIWDPVTGDLLRSLEDPSGSRNVVGLAAAVAIDGSAVLAGCCDGGRIGLWDPETGQLLDMLTGQEPALYGCAFTTLPDGTVILASASTDGAARLWRLSDRSCLSVLNGSDRAVSVAFAGTGDGRLALATGSRDTRIRIWDLGIEAPAAEMSVSAFSAPSMRLDAEPRLIAGHHDTVYGVAFVDLPDGTTALVSAGDGRVEIRDPVSGRSLKRLQGSAGTIAAFATHVTPGGVVLLATDSSDHTVRIWDLVSGEELAVLTGHTENPWAVAFAALPGGSALLASAAYDHTVRIWDPYTQRHIRTLVGHSEALYAVAFGVLPDGSSILASAGADSAIRLWDPLTGEHLRILTGHPGVVYGLAFTRLDDATTVLASVGSGEGPVRLWDPASGRLLRTLDTGNGSVDTGNGSVGSVAFAVLPSGTTVLVAACDDRVWVWDALTHDCLFASEKQPGTLWSAALGSLPDGSVYLAAGGDSGLLWSARMSATGQGNGPQTDGTVTEVEEVSVRTLPGPALDINVIAFGRLRDGSDLLACGGDNTTVEIWDPDSGDHLRSLEGHTARIWGVAFGTLPDGTTLLASASNDRTVRVWDPVTGTALHRLTGHEGGAHEVRFGALADGSVVLAAGCGDSNIRLWDPVTGDHLRTLSGHTNGVWPLAFTRLPDGSDLMASGSVDNTVKLWDPATGRQLRTLRSHTDSVYGLRFEGRQDGSAVLASCGIDGSLRLSDPVTGQQVGLLDDEAGPLWSVDSAVNHAGESVTVTGAHRIGDVRIWNLAEARLLLRREVPTSQAVAVRWLDAHRFQIAVGGERGQLSLLTMHTRGGGSAPTPARPAGSRSDARWAADLIALAGSNLDPPLALLADLVAITGGEAPRTGAIATLAEHPGVSRLRGLAWPHGARVGFAALLAEDLPADDRYTAPPAPKAALHRALLAALDSPPGDGLPEAVPLDLLRAAANRINDQVIALLTVLGPDAVAADPILPVRLRHHAPQLLSLDVEPRTLLLDVTRQLERDASGRASTSAQAAGVNGLVRRGTLPNLVHTELALPLRLFAARYAQDQLLYRLRDGGIETPLAPVTIVLDTTPPTFGPVEMVLRLVAHTIATNLWITHKDAHLIRLDAPDRAVPLIRPADLIEVWCGRTLEPASTSLTAALNTATYRRQATTVLLTQHHLVSDQDVVARASVRVLTTHAPGDPPRRPFMNPYHLHLPPKPSAAEVLKAVLRLLAPAVRDPVRR